MIGELLSVPGAMGAFVLSLLIFGFAPGMVLAAIVRLIPDQDRRRELQAELYEVPRWERPYWVAQQFEVALRIGVSPELQVVANWNPVSVLAAACRRLLGDPDPAAGIPAWPMQHPELASALWSLGLLAVVMPLAVSLCARRNQR